MSEALIFELTNPQYDDRLFIALQCNTWKFLAQNMGRTCCVQKLFLTFRAISVHNMFSPCSAKRRASDKDLPVRKINFIQIICNLSRKMWQKLFEMRLCVMRYILALVCLTFTPKLTQGHFQCEQFLMKEVLLPLLRWIIHSALQWNEKYIFVSKLRYYEKAKKFEKISNRFWHNSCFYSVASKQVGDFFKFLWPFQKSLILPLNTIAIKNDG